MSFQYSDKKSVRRIFEVIEWSLIHCFDLDEPRAQEAIVEHYSDHAHHREDDLYYRSKSAFSISVEIYYENVMRRKPFTEEYWRWRRREGLDMAPERYMAYERTRL